ncbi:MAG: carbohydrate kinase family protein [Candidatus Thermoplasmatota archaeon]|jgi:sugar/nucleoside kinase (ribokinase family)|nr:carbohydrate kinase family protein [Candidatus Thermoplasmatota archaeon]
MLNEETKKRLLEKLKQIDKHKLQDIHVVLLPDFFVDHFLYLDEFENTFTRIKNIYQQGGGNLPGVKQKIHQGGNAANTALALARLGIKPHLICKTNEFGLKLLQYFLGRNNVDLSRVKTNGELAITTVLEFGEKHTNIMIGDPGSVAEFTFETLDEKDLELISNSEILCVLNWNLNKKGTELAKEAFRFARQKKVKTFFDTGDPSPRKNDIPALIKTVLTDKNLDILSLNENELKHYTNTQTNSKDELIKSANHLKSKINARIDLHTSLFSCTINKKTTVVPTQPKLKIKRAAGAGDSWNAGDIFSELLGFEDDERLFFANSTAEYYISSPTPIHPNLEEISKYISSR